MCNCNKKSIRVRGTTQTRGTVQTPGVTQNRGIPRTPVPRGMHGAPRSVKQYASLFNTGKTSTTTRFKASNTVAPANPRTVNVVTTQRSPPSTFSSVNNGRNNNRKGRQIYNQNIDNMILYQQRVRSKRYNRPVVVQKRLVPANKYESLTKEQLQSWDRIHEMAITATTPELKKEFSDYMNYLSTNFPCPMCANHIQERLRLKPLTTLPVQLENNRDVSYARWSWEFHNEINAKTNKPQVSWEYYKGKYLSRF